MNNLRYCVYILLSHKDNKLYIGYSADLQTRLKDHMNGKVESTAPRRPLQLVHIECYLAESDAIRREKYLKTTKGKRALKFMLRDIRNDRS